MCWVKPGNLATTLSKKAYVERQGVGKLPRFACVPSKDRLRFEFSPADNRSDTNYDYIYDWDDRWHHVAFVARISGSSPTYEIYLDAQKRAEGTLIKPSGVDAVSNTAPIGSIYVGNYSTHVSPNPESFANDTYWHGKIDDILCFNAAKSQTDINTYFTSRDTWALGDSELIFNWRFDENAGSTTTDSDNDGTGGDPLWQGTLYQSGSTSTALWTIDRPFLGNGNLDTTPPSPAPASLSTTNITSDGFTASWGTTVDNVYVQGYIVDVSTVSNFSSLVGTPFDVGLATSLTVSGLNPATPYFWRVKAYDAANNISSPSSTASLTTSAAGDISAPNPPTDVQTSGVISFSSFTLQWTASSSSDETGYKLDISTDPFFSTYLSGFRAKDVGNVTTALVTGAAPLTTYYVRLRAYDAAGNESLESTTFVLQTAALPDLISPTTIELEQPSSISGSAFTANWVPGSDDVGVISYEIDVSVDVNFSSYVQSALYTWQARNVGNVTSVRVTGLQPDTTYFYRVRARDAAGNTSSNPTTPASATTDISTWEDEGTFTTRVVANRGSYVSVGSPTTHFGDSTGKVDVAKSGGTELYRAYLRFDLNGTVGTISSAMLNFYNETATTPLTSVDIMVMATDSVNHDTVTYNTRPIMTGSTITKATGAVGWYSVDITSLLLSGGTVYTVEIKPSAAATGGTNRLRLYNATLEENGTNSPGLGAYIEVEHNPSTATHLEDLEVANLDGQRKNLVINPNFDGNTTTGWTVKSGSTVTNDATNGLNSSRALKVVTAASTGSGVTYGSLTNSPVSTNQWYTLSFYAKASASSTPMHVFFTQFNSSNTLLATQTSQLVTLSTSMERYSISYLANQGSVAYLVANFQSTSATSITFYLDRVLIENSVASGAYFDGTTSGAYWTGSANASWSMMDAAKFSVESPYTGDSDDDNSAVFYFRPRGQTGWIRTPGMDSTITMDRVNRRAIATIGPSYGPYNYLKNPSFENGTTHWSSNNGLSTLSTTTDYAVADEQSLQVVVTGSTGNTGILSTMVPVTAGQTWQARASVLAPVGMTVAIAIEGLNSALVSQGFSSVVSGVSDTNGDGTWKDLYVSYTLPATSVFARVQIRRSNTVSGTFYVDAAALGRGDWGLAYLSGSEVGGVWEGTPHDSYTSAVVLNNYDYDVLIEYTDPDGMFDNAGTTTAGIGLTYHTSEPTDKATTHETFETELDSETISIIATYSGDDTIAGNTPMTAQLAYKRSDFSAYTLIPTQIDRVNKAIRGTITSLKPGTAYTIRLAYTDPDGLFNTINGEVFTTVVTTTNLETAEGPARITFGGFVLSDDSSRENHFGVTEHDAFGFPERRINLQELPINDGSIELSNYWGSRKINMKGFVDANSRAELEDNVRSLRRALAPSQQKLVIDTLGTTGRFYYASVESLSISEVAGTNFRHLTWDADFTCSNPFAYDNAESILTEFVVADGDTIAIFNDGDVRAEPVFRIRTRNSSRMTFSVGNQTTGEYLTPAQTIINGDRVVIDTGRLDVLKNGTGIDYQGTFPRLEVGANTLAFTVSPTFGHILVEVRWRNRYL